MERVDRGRENYKNRDVYRTQSRDKPVSRMVPMEQSKRRDFIF